MLRKTDYMRDGSGMGSSLDQTQQTGRGNKEHGACVLHAYITHVCLWWGFCFLLAPHAGLICCCSAGVLCHSGTSMSQLVCRRFWSGGDTGFAAKA